MGNFSCVGIGTISPSQKLEVSGTDNNNLIMSTSTTGAGGTFRIQANEAASYLVSNNARPLYIQTNSATVMTITSTGNIGIGTTPCTWAAPTAGKVIQLGNRSSLFSYNNNTLDLATNFYFDGGDYRYIQSAYATLLRGDSSDGTFVFYNAGSGTAGCVVSLNERMRITNAGSACFTGTVISTAPSNGHNFRGLGFTTAAIASGGSCLIYSSLDRGLYLISISSSVTSTFGYSAFLWVDSGAITVSSIIRQSCVSITTSGRALCVVNPFGSEAAVMTINTLNLVNYL
jgi:hypothetical protein